MLSPENPSCSPEVLGTTHPLLLLTLSASVPVPVLLLRLLLAAHFPLLYQSVSGQSTCRHVGLHLSKAYRCPASIVSLHWLFMIDGLYVSCSRGRIDTQYDASIRDWRNCDDLTLLLAAVQTHTHAHTTNRICKTC